MSDRTLSDADIEALAEAVVPKLKAALIEDFHKDLGKGIWGFAWRGFLVAMLVVTAVGAGVLKLPGVDLWPKH